MNVSPPHSQETWLSPGSLIHAGGWLISSNLRESAVRLSVVLLACSVAGVLGGGALIGTAALGGCLIFVSLCTAAWALARDDGQAVPQARQVPRTLHDIFERARQAS